MLALRRLGAGILALAMLLAVSGCVKLDMDLTVHADNSLDGTFVIAVDKRLLTASGRSEEDFLKSFDS